MGIFDGWIGMSESDEFLGGCEGGSEVSQLSLNEISLVSGAWAARILVQPASNLQGGLIRADSRWNCRAAIFGRMPRETVHSP